MKQQPVKRRPGRPPVERRRVPMAMRVTPELSDQLVARAKAKGRSLTQELEILLEQSLLTEQLLGRTGLRPLVDIVTEFMAHGAHRAAEQDIDGDWTQDPECYRAAAMAAFRRLLANAPAPWDQKLWEIHLTTIFNNFHLRRTQGPGGFVDQGSIEPIVVDLPDWEEEKP